MAGYEFGFLMEQSLGYVTLAKNLVANVALTRRCTTIWDWPTLKPRELPEGSLCTRSTRRCGQVRACRMNRQTRRDALFFHNRCLPSSVSLDDTPRQYDELGAFYKHEESPAWLRFGNGA
jgi:hypothetical protein